MGHPARSVSQRLMNQYYAFYMHVRHPQYRNQASYIDFVPKSDIHLVEQVVQAVDQNLEGRIELRVIVALRKKNVESDGKQSWEK